MGLNMNNPHLKEPRSRGSIRITPIVDLSEMGYVKSRKVHNPDSGLNMKMPKEKTLANILSIGILHSTPFRVGTNYLFISTNFIGGYSF
jgi:hypothetical protein